MKDTKDNLSKLSDLLDDLQETLDNSILSENNKNKKTEEPEIVKRVRDNKTVDELFDTLFDDLEKPEQQNAKPAVKEKKEKKSAVKEPEIKEIKKAKKHIPVIEDTAEVEDEDESEEETDNPENADMDLELLKAIGIGKASGYYPVSEDEGGGKKKGQSGKSKKDPNPAKTKKTPKKQPARSLYKISKKEYTTREQITEIFVSYQKTYKSEHIKLGIGIFLFLILFYMELAPFLNWKLPNEFNVKFYNLPYIYINMQILLIVAALNIRSLIYGLKSMIWSNINAYSISFVFCLVGFAHTLVTLYMRYNNPDIVLYNSIAVYGMLLTGVYNILDMKSEIASFKTVSSKNPKYALSLSGPAKTSAAAPHSENPYRSLEYEPELFKDIVHYNASAAGILKTPFISNFFARTNKDKDYGGNIKYFVYTALFASVILLAFYTLSTQEKDWYIFISSITALILGSVPLCSFIIYIYPVFKAQNKARAAGAAFIGGRSLEESADNTIISIYDRDIFPADKIKLSSIKVFGNNRLDEVVQNLCVIFDKLNMPPADTFKATTNFNSGFNKDIDIINIDDEGICYASNGRKLFLGTIEYISNTGLIPPYDSNTDDPFVNSSGSIMILATETEIIAKIYIKYEISADFYDIIKNIKKINACLCIRTFDPNIDETLLNRLGNIKKFPIRVLKLKEPADTQSPPERMDSPVISKDSVKSLINAVLIAVRTKRVMKSNVMLQTFAFGASILTAVICGFTGHLWGINAGHLFVLQTFWLFPVLLFQGITP